MANIFINSVLLYDLVFFAHCFVPSSIRNEFILPAFDNYVMKERYKNIYTKHMSD